MPALLMALLGKVVPEVIDRTLPPEKMSEADRAQLAQQMQLALMQQDWSAVEAEFKDRDSARGLAAAEIAKGNAFTSFLAATVRPAWGLGAFALVAYSVIGGQAIAAPLESIIQSVLAFYFGGRVLEKLGPTVAAALKK